MTRCSQFVADDAHDINIVYAHLHNNLDWAIAPPASASAIEKAENVASYMAELRSILQYVRKDAQQRRAVEAARAARERRTAELWETVRLDLLVYVCWARGLLRGYARARARAVCE